MSRSEGRPPVRWLVALALLAWGGAAATWFWPHAAPELRVEFVDVGEGDATLIRTPGGAVVLVDAGPVRGGGSAVVRALKSWGTRRIDVFVWTHPDADHIGGVAEVMRAAPVGMVLESGFHGRSATYAETLRLAEGSGARMVVACEGQRILFGDGARIEVLNPPSWQAATSNDDSVVVRVAFGERTFLLTGDAGTLVEERLTEHGADVRADVLKVAHHGSASATGWDWLGVVGPRYAVISCGAGNHSGHPDPAVIERLRRRGVRVYRTDLSGTIDCTTDGRKLTFELASPR